jgi:hypothetical protein
VLFIPCLIELYSVIFKPEVNSFGKDVPLSTGIVEFIFRQLRMDILIFEILGTFLGIIFPIISLYWVFKPPEYFWEEHKNITYFVFFGAFISCAIIFVFGFESYLGSYLKIGLMKKISVIL